MEHESLIYRTDALILALSLFALSVLSIYVGRVVGLKRFSLRKEDHAPATGTIISALLALMGFLLAFTFGMSSNRFDARRKTVVDEANAIGTATLRSDMYNDDQRTFFRKDFQQYIEARIDYYEGGKDMDKLKIAEQNSDVIGKRIWNRAAQLSHNRDNYVASMVMINALNLMLDARTTRGIAERARVPDTIVWMLFIILMANAFYIGYSSAGKGHFDWIVAIGFCLLTSIVIYITLDLDRPRRGFITLNVSQKAMLELRNLFVTDSTVSYKK